MNDQAAAACAIYRRRRDALLDALARHLPDVRPTGASAGLHVLGWLPPDLDEDAVVEAAAAADVALAGLAPRRVGPGPAGLVLGFGVIAEGAIEPGIERLAAVIAGLRPVPAGLRSRPSDWITSA